MKIRDALLNLLYPKRANCMGCGAATGCREDWVCPACREDLARGWVGAEMPPKYLDAAAYGYVYRGAAAGMVRRLKYSGVGKLAAFMGRDMVRAYRFIEPTGADCVCCVPMHSKRLRQRGRNHAELLARDVAARLELPYLDALERTRDTRQQARLDELEKAPANEKTVLDMLSLICFFCEGLTGSAAYIMGRIVELLLEWRKTGSGEALRDFLEQFMEEKE